MLHIIVLLEIKDPDAFHQFETQAIAILGEHGGELVLAFEPQDTGISNEAMEIHHLQFPNKEAFDNYRSDSRLKALGPRSK